MSNRIEKITIPDIGGASGVDVIEVLIKVGDQITKETPMITLEGDKATMEVPAPMDGEVTEVLMKVGDKVSEGDVVCSLKVSGEAAAPAAAKTPSTTVEPTKAAVSAPAPQSSASATVSASRESVHKGPSYAGPAVRRLAFELDIQLSEMRGTGPKGRITKEDLHAYIKSRMKSGGGLNVAPMPAVDFKQFGDIEQQPLSKIKKISGANLHRNWVQIPHVTQFGQADITDLETFRKSQKEKADERGVKLTPLVFLMKAVVHALKLFPNFNASLDASGENLILKKYFHVGVAVDTPNGLVVPVIRDVDQKSLFDLAQELADISKKAREKGLSLKEMQGGCFSISSLGGIGGTAFTPIINAPEVAILGVSKMEIRPCYIENELQPRMMLPLSLSYDHRVIDGADGARFIAALGNALGDIRTWLLE